MTIGERIKKIRNECGLSTYDLSKMTGISQSSISKMENGKRKIDNLVLEKIAGALNISVDRLTGESVSCIIEQRLEDLNITLEQVAKKSSVPLKWLQNIDSFIPGEMEFMIEEGRALDWEDPIGDYTSYKWITKVAEILNIPGGILRAALARQETPVPDMHEIPRITAREAFGFAQNNNINDNKNERLQLNSNEITHIRKYRNLDDFGRETVNTVLDRETKRVEDLQTKQEHIDQLKQRIVTELIKRIPLPFYAGLASAGSGEYLFDDIPMDVIEVPDTPISRKADFIIGVSGDSMEPDFYNGEKVFVKKTTNLNTGDIGIFLKGEDCYIKELGRDRLISHNPDKDNYPDVKADEDIIVVGKVIGKVEE